MILPPKIIYSNHQNKVEFKNLDDSEVPSCDFPGLRTSAASMTSTASTTSVASMTSSASFHQKNTELDFSINPGTKMTCSRLTMWAGSSKTHHFLDFWHPFFWRLWRTGMLLLTKSKGHKSNSPYSGFPNHLQTKSNLYISIWQSQIHYVKSKWDTL